MYARHDVIIESARLWRKDVNSNSNLLGQVSATAYNEGSSRSHTILRLSIESSERPSPDADPTAKVDRTLSFLNLIDLAGSESAKVRV